MIDSNANYKEPSQTTKFPKDKMKSEIPIIAVSADVTEMVTIKCKQIGMSEYLSKPFVKNDLVEIIERLIKQ